MSAKFSVLVLGVFLAFSPVFAESENQVVIGVNGMVCAFCAQGIEKQFRSEDAVQNIKVELADRKVTLTLKPGQDLKDDQIRRRITAAGYVVRDIKRTN